MRSLNSFDTPERSQLNIRLADVNVRVEAPERVLLVLDDTLANVPRFESSVSPDLTISVVANAEAWEIQGAGGSRKVLPAQSALPQVAGAIVTSAINDTAASQQYIPMRATVIEKGGRALAMIGDDWESSITLAAHLHGRGWSYVGSDGALLVPATLGVFSIQKSLYVNASSVAQFPVRYRRAVEASPWYVTPQGISFYAVDPNNAVHGGSWSSNATLSGLVIVDGGMSDRPSLESVDVRGIRSERLERLGINWDRVPAADLKLGSFVETCDLVEHWFGSLQP